MVIDASTALASILIDEYDAYADSALEHALTTGAIVPALWHYEVQNGLLLALRRGRIDSEVLRRSLESIRTWNVRVELAFGFGEEIELARETGLTVYDATYIAVARRVGARLATNDRRMRAAAESIGVAIYVA